jgi:hypothetical protein
MLLQGVLLAVLVVLMAKFSAGYRSIRNSIA